MEERFDSGDVNTITDYTDLLEVRENHKAKVTVWKNTKVF